MRRALLLPLLLLALAPASGALGVPGPSGIRLAASHEGGTLHVDVGAEAAGASVSVVVSHEDPLVGEVVDRVVPLDLAARVDANVSLQGLRPDVDFSVRVLDANVTIPTLSNGTTLPNGSRLRELPSLARIDRIPAQRSQGGTRAFAAYPVYTGPLSYPAHLHASPDGILSVTFNRHVGPLDGGEDHLSVATSRDGGHTWTAPLTLSERIPNNLYSWSDTTLPDGTILAYYVTSNGTTEARFHPDSGAVERRVASASTFGRLAAAALPDGRVVLAGWLERDPEHPRPEDRLRLAVWRLETDGSRTDLATFRGAWSQVLATPAGLVEVVWEDQDLYGGLGGHLYRAVALDGSTFSEPELLGGSGVGQPAALALDATGTLHALVERLQSVAWRNGTDGDFALTNISLEYDRFPLAGPASRLAIAGTPDAILPDARGPGPIPVIAVRGARLWILWQDTKWDDDARHGQGDGSYAMESVDGGATFGAPDHLRTTEGTDVQNAADLDTFPDGRPVLLAGAFEGGIAVYPLFDPIPPPGILDQVTFASFAPPTPEPARLADPTPEPTPDPTPEPAVTPLPGPRVGAAVPAALALAGAAVVGAVAATETGKVGLGLAAAALYSRLRKGDVLKNDVRAGIHAHVRDHPGIRYEDLRRDLGLSNGALAHHLRTLEREGFVLARSSWTRRRYYATGSAPAPVATRAPETLRAMLREVPSGLTAAEVAQRLGSSRQLARYHLTALARAGEAEVVGAGRGRRYRAPMRGARTTTFHVVE